MRSTLIAALTLATATLKLLDPAKARARGHREENTYGLPDGAPIRDELRRWYRKQKAAVLGTTAALGVSLPTHFPDLATRDWDDPMKTAMTPLIGSYWRESYQAVAATVGLDPGPWEVVSPFLLPQIERQSYAFCHATNQSTTKRLDVALRQLREGMAAGLVEHGEALPELRARVASIFDKLSKSHAGMIAATEASRSVHLAQLKADEDSGVVAGLELLLSADACPLCRKVAAEARRVRLGQPFAIIGTHPEYSVVRTPPLHPHCQCAVIEILKPEYGGPPDVEWDATLVQPKAGPDYEPPAGKEVPGPEPEKKTKPRPAPVHHFVAPDRVPKPATWTEESPDYLPPPKPAKKKAPPKPAAAKPAPKPAPQGFPADPASLAKVKALGGSTGAELVENKATGERFVRKAGANAGHLREEAQADALYRAMGVPTPASKLYETPAGPVKLAEFHQGVTLGQLRATDPAAAAKAEAEIRKHFVADALLGNWDVVGMGADNVLVTPDGKVYRIDNGGALRYRAQGQPKSASQWNGDLNELASLRDPKVNPSAAKVFGAITDKEIAAQAKTLLAARSKILDAAGDPALKKTLAARLDTLESLYGQAKGKPPKAGGWTPKPAKDFEHFPSIRKQEEWGTTQYRPWAGTLAKEQARWVGDYSRNGFRWMNAKLRGVPLTGMNAPPPGMTPAEQDAAIAEVTEALKRGRTDRDVRAFRGVKDFRTMGWKDLDSLKAGDPLKVESFGSVSINQDKAQDFADGGKHPVILQVHLPKGSTGGYLNAGGFSTYPSERELLLPPGTEYRIVGRGPDQLNMYGIPTPVVIVERVK